MLGLGMIAWAGMLVHFVLALNPWVSGGAWLVGAGLFWRRRRWLAEGLSCAELVTGGAAVTLLVALMQPPWRLYDAGLYYFQTMRWLTEQPIQPGIVNLHIRLAFNSTWFIVAAVFEHPLTYAASNWFVNLFPMTFAAAGAGAALHRARRGDLGFANLATVAMVVPIAVATDGLGAHAADHVLTILVPFTLLLWARALGPDGDLRAEARAALLISVFAMTVKVSSAPLAAGSAALVLWRCRDLGRRWFLYIGAFASVWVARSLLLSGCLVYPAAATCIPGIRWTPDPAAVHYEAQAIWAWGRNPGLPPEAVLGSWAWVHGWIARILEKPEHLLLAALVLLGIVAFALSLRRMRRELAAPCVVAAGGVAYWFATAPDPRFASGFFIALAILPVTFALSELELLRAPVARWAAASVLAAAAAALVVTNGVVTLAIERPWPIPIFDFPYLPLARSATAWTRSGLAVSVPLEGDQCWANEPPCTCTLDPELARDWAFVRRDQLVDGAR
jgi:hypothetical protein